MQRRRPALARGHDDRATGFYGQYTTYAEALQLIMSLALGLFIALPRKRSTRGLLLAARPGRVREMVPVTLPNPRRLAMRETPEFVALAGHLRRVLEGC